MHQGQSLCAPPAGWVDGVSQVTGQYRALGHAYIWLLAVSDVRVGGRAPPGTLKEGLVEQLGLVPKEVSIVMTDVQGSSRLWEW